MAAQINAHTTILLTVGPWKIGESLNTLNLVSTNRQILAIITRIDPVFQALFLFSDF